jgi:hypothetical protein
MDKQIKEAVARAKSTIMTSNKVLLELGVKKKPLEAKNADSKYAR